MPYERVPSKEEDLARSEEMKKMVCAICEIGLKEDELVVVSRGVVGDRVAWHKRCLDAESDRVKED